MLLAAVYQPSFTEETKSVEISFPGFPWTHVGGTRLTIPPGVTRSIDVARVHGKVPKAANDLANKFELLIEPTPGNHRNRLDPGTYELFLTVSAHNANAVEYYTRVNYDPSAGESPTETITVIDQPTTNVRRAAQGRAVEETRS